MLVVFYCKIMPLPSFRLSFAFFELNFAFFSILNHTISIMLKHKQDIFFFFSIQNIKSNCYTIFLRFFQISFFWWKRFSLPFTFINKRFSFSKFLWMFFSFLHNLTHLLQLFKNICYLFYWWNLLLLLCLFYPVWRIFILPTTI